MEGGLAGGYPPLALATLRQDQPCSAKKQVLNILVSLRAVLGHSLCHTGTLLGKICRFHFEVFLLLCGLCVLDRCTPQSYFHSALINVNVKMTVLWGQFS